MIGISLFCIIFCLINPTYKARATSISTATNVAESDSVLKEVKIFYDSLNAEEKAKLRKFAKTNAANFSLTDPQFMDGIKEEAAGLFSKLIGFRDALNAKLEIMQPESRAFIEQALRKFLAAFGQDGLLNILDAIKGLGKQLVDMYDGLSAEAQRDILKAFPTIGSFATNDIVRLLLRKIAEFDLLTKTWTSSPTVGLDVENFESDGKSSKFLPTNTLPFTRTDNKEKNLKIATMYPNMDDDDEENETPHVKAIVKNI